MARLIRDFAGRFAAKLSINDRLVINKANKYFLVNENLQKSLARDFFFAGSLLGETKKGEFIPGFELLRLIAKGNSNKVIVDSKSEWLFICGRDLFKRGITKVTKPIVTGDYTLVLNQHYECLGFGRVIKDLDKATTGVVIQNLLDVGDFLRREA